MRQITPRLAVRALIVHRGKLLLVNAWPDGQSDLLCVPGGGVEPGTSLPENVRREVLEETGLTVTVGAPCLVNEFHDPKSGFHQVDVYFHCSLEGSTDIPSGWQDPEAVVTKRLWVDKEEMANLRFKPDSLRDLAFGAPEYAILYDPLEELVR